jgi:hypothetical protein
MLRPRALYLPVSPTSQPNTMEMMATCISTLRTSSTRKTPWSFSRSYPGTPCTEKSRKASLISASCSLVMLFSRASFVSRGCVATCFPRALLLRFGAWLVLVDRRYQIWVIRTFHLLLMVRVIIRGKAIPRTRQQRNSDGGCAPFKEYK